MAAPRSFHVANVTAKEVRPLIVTNANRASAIMTDESPIYPKIGKEFRSHYSVNHSADEYVRLGSYIHVNTAESFFSILKLPAFGFMTEEQIKDVVGKLTGKLGTVLPRDDPAG